MRTLADIPEKHWPSPVPLDLTPRWMFILGWPLWRYRDNKGWVYITRRQYRSLFGKAKS